MITVCRAWHFYGAEHLPERFRAPGPFHFSPDDLQELTLRYDVMLHHSKDGLVLALDGRGERFHSR